MHDVFTGRKTEAALEEPNELAAAVSEKTSKGSAVEVMAQMLVDISGYILQGLGGEPPATEGLTGRLAQTAKHMLGEYGADAFDVFGAAGVGIAADLPEGDGKLQEENVSGADLPQRDADCFRQ